MQEDYYYSHLIWISADYRLVEIVKSLTSTNEDLFGPIVSIRAKLNSIVHPNWMVIGSDLYQIVKSSLGENIIFLMK